MKKNKTNKLEDITNKCTYLVDQHHSGNHNFYVVQYDEGLYYRSVAIFSKGKVSQFQNVYKTRLEKDGILHTYRYKGRSCYDPRIED